MAKAERGAARKHANVAETVHEKGRESGKEESGIYGD